MKKQLFITLFSLLSLTASAYDAEINGIFYYLSGNFFCTELRHVYCYATTPPNIPRGGAFNSIVRATTLHVPAASIEAYKANESWNRFKSIMAIE